MNFAADERPFQLKLDGKLTFERRHVLEASVIDAMRQHPRLETDLSAVSEIDLYGVHLLGLLKNVGTIVAISPSVEEASRRLLSSSRGASLGRPSRLAQNAQAVP